MDNYVPNMRFEADARKQRAAQACRVCQASHRTIGVKVPEPGTGGAEGQEKGKGVTVRWGLKEAQSKSAGRGTRTGSEVWHVWDERARDREVLHSPMGRAL